MLAVSHEEIVTEGRCQCGFAKEAYRSFDATACLPQNATITFADLCAPAQELAEETVSCAPALRHSHQFLRSFFLLRLNPSSPYQPSLSRSSAPARHQASSRHQVSGAKLHLRLSCSLYVLHCFPTVDISSTNGSGLPSWMVIPSD